MKNSKKIIVTLLLIVSSSVFAQQESVIAFYTNHLNLVNPAAVSITGETVLTSSIRKQWTGVKDAPETQALSFMMPLNKKVNLGMSIVRDQVFIEKQTFISVDFSYKVELNEEYNLFMGIKAGGNNYEVNTNGLQTYNVLMDPSLQPISRFNPNIGIGFYLQNKDFFVSLSTPKMLDTQRAKNEDGYASAATDRAHYYLTTGRNFTINETIKLSPTMMIRYINGAPFSIDLTTFVNVDNSIHLGATYRTDKTFVGLTKLKVNKNIAIGYAYEYSLRSELLGRANGSNEFYLQYRF